MNKVRTMVLAGGVVAAVGVAACGGSSGGGASVATDCVHPVITDPAGGSGNTAVSASLNGDWPSNATITASVTFADDQTPRTFSGHGRTVTVGDAGGGLVSTARVWVTGDSTSGIECGTWVRQP